jgi:hypothetical protein
MLAPEVAMGTYDANVNLGRHAIGLEVHRSMLLRLVETAIDVKPAVEAGNIRAGR